MKRIISFALSAVALLGIYACNNDLNKVFDPQTPLVEFQPAVVNAASAGRTYPLLSVTNSVTAGNSVTVQVNLLGRKPSSDVPVRVLVDPSTTAAASSYTLSNGGVATFATSAPNSNTAGVTLTVARATSSTAPVGNLILVIDSTSTDFKPSRNYMRVGYSFRQ